MKTKQWRDPIVEDVRAAREAMYDEADGDLDTLVEQLMERQQRHGDRLVRAPRKRQVTYDVIASAPALQVGEENGSAGN